MTNVLTLDDLSWEVWEMRSRDGGWSKVLPDIELGAHKWRLQQLFACGEDRLLRTKAGHLRADQSYASYPAVTELLIDIGKGADSEVVAWSKGVFGEAQKPIVISGPSARHTTHAPRNKELDWAHYRFTERSVMEKDIEDGKFLEFASVQWNLYGTSVEAVESPLFYQLVRPAGSFTTQKERTSLMADGNAFIAMWDARLITTGIHTPPPRKSTLPESFVTTQKTLKEQIAAIKELFAANRAKLDALLIAMGIPIPPQPKSTTPATSSTVANNNIDPVDTDAPSSGIAVHDGFALLGAVLEPAAMPAPIVQENTSVAVLPKMDLSRFDEKNLTRLTRVEQYFLVHRIPLGERLQMAVVAMTMIWIVWAPWMPHRATNMKGIQFTYDPGGAIRERD
ncbi:Guanylate kinase 2 [Orobanche minor]